MKNQGTIIIAGLVLLAIASFFFISPSTTGNVVKDANPNSCEDKLATSDSKLKAAEAELTSCNQLKSAAITDMQKLQAPEKCDTTDLDSRIADLTKQKTSLLKSLKDAQDKAKDCVGDTSVVQQLNDTITELAKNSANNICCKMRVDNPNIKAYNIDGNKINCLESGDLLLACP